MVKLSGSNPKQARPQRYSKPLRSFNSYHFLLLLCAATVAMKSGEEQIDTQIAENRCSKTDN